MLNIATSKGTRKVETQDRETRLANSREKRDLVMSKIREGYFPGQGSFVFSGICGGRCASR
jgi:hypothetical protein